VCGSQERCVDLVGSFRCQPCSDDDDGSTQCGTRACQSNPCRHGATCEPRQNGGFSCLCRRGFTGTRCQNPANTEPQPPTASCRPGQCLNGGRCVTTTNGLAMCLCIRPWLGRYCQVSAFALIYKIKDPPTKTAISLKRRTNFK